MKHSSLNVLVVLAVLYAAVLPKVFAISEKEVAGIVYAETSGLRLKGQNAAEMTLIRGRIADISYKRDGKGLAAPIYPTNEELGNPTVKAIWEECQKVAKPSSVSDPGDCQHFVIWPSTDGKTPTDNPKIPANPPWPYTQASKIKDVWGPFSVPVKVGDVPKGENIYIFVYCGVK